MTEAERPAVGKARRALGQVLANVRALGATYDLDAAGTWVRLFEWVSSSSVRWVGPRMPAAVFVRVGLPMFEAGYLAGVAGRRGWVEQGKGE